MTRESNKIARYARSRRVPDWVKSAGMYVKTNTPISNLGLEELTKLLCARCAGDITVCRTCAGGCQAGRELIRRFDREAGK